MADFQVLLKEADRLSGIINCGICQPQEFQGNPFLIPILDFAADLQRLLKEADGTLDVSDVSVGAPQAD